ncbi:MAG TPA: hypothetical protein VJ746_11640 [Nitrospira sp.]|nr:hypothetical protein [Nitrospira sp.]
MLHAVQQDIGCIQQGPLRIDVPATWAAHARFHERWQERVKEESEAMRAIRPRVVMADTPYLAIRAGALAGIPTVGLANFTWNEVLEPFADPDQSAHRALLAEIRQSYNSAALALRIAPGLPLSAFRHIIDVAPIGEPDHPRRAELRAHMKIPGTDRLVLIGFGGIPLASLPWEAMENMEGYRFIVDDAVPPHAVRVVSLGTLPYRFKTVLASVDVVMTKPGYGTVVEAVAAGVGVLYVRRYNFADEAPLVDFLHRYGRAAELSLNDFDTGRWQPALEDVCHRTLPGQPPACTGAREAAALLAQYC